MVIIIGLRDMPELMLNTFFAIIIVEKPDFGYVDTFFVAKQSLAYWSA